MLKAISYGVPAVFALSIVNSLIFTGQARFVMLAFVLASPILLAWIAWYART